MSEKAALSKLGNDMQMVVTCLGARKPQKDASGSGTWTENGKRPNSILGRRTKKVVGGASLVVHQPRLYACNAGGPGSIPG